MIKTEYDIIVIGAGIAGVCSAFFLQQKGLSVLVVDRSGVAASGGSSAAGAFVSPKIGKGSELQKLTNEAFEFAKDFYLNNFPKYFTQTGIIRIPKDNQDAQKFIEYEKYNSSKREWIDKDKFQSYGIKEENIGFLFYEAGVCDAPKMCSNILTNIDFKQHPVEKLIYKDGYWYIEHIKAHKIVLATGYENTLFDMRYMGVKGTWGSRGDYKSSLNLKISMHKKISISANIDGIIKLGATHVKAKDPCMACDGKPLKSLEELASTMVNTEDFILQETFCGMRSGSKDYFPLVGDVIDVEYMLSNYPKILKGAKPPIKKINNIYICNGLGGRGFVFAPLMGKILADYIINGVEIDSRVNPDRLFLKWCRKSPDLIR
ncbi:MAG: FAD-dependent oxidoreductase [Epsilonproteobacteria bacterium]|nr:FAD-dependent oxidoreductase [Campylobacterota bacterium]